MTRGKGECDGLVGRCSTFNPIPCKRGCFLTRMHRRSVGQGRIWRSRKLGRQPRMDDPSAGSVPEGHAELLMRAFLRPTKSLVQWSERDGLTHGAPRGPCVD